MVDSVSLPNLPSKHQLQTLYSKRRAIELTANSIKMSSEQRYDNYFDEQFIQDDLPDFNRFGEPTLPLIVDTPSSYFQDYFANLQQEGQAFSNDVDIFEQDLQFTMTGDPADSLSFGTFMTPDPPASATFGSPAPSATFRAAGQLALGAENPFDQDIAFQAFGHTAGHFQTDGFDMPPSVWGTYSGPSTNFATPNDDVAPSPYLSGPGTGPIDVSFF